MRLVTRNQYSRVMTENIDGMHDIGFSLAVPANTSATTYESFTIPAGYVGVLRYAHGNVEATPVAGRAYVLARMTRPGQPAVDLFRVRSDAGTSDEIKVVSTSCHIIMPEGTEVVAAYANFDGTGARRLWLYLVIDLIRL